MALAYQTYRAIPTLKTYGEALAHHDKVKPIRGREIECRPCGRRDQTFFTIWKDAMDQVHVGYGGNEHGKRTKLVTYHPTGHISLFQRYRGAATNERLQSLLSVDFVTHQYQTWVRCNFYDNGLHRKGWLPLRDGEGGMEASNFVRSSAEFNGMTFINYRYPLTHKLNRAAIKEFMTQAEGFVRYASGMVKLAGGRLDFGYDTLCEAFGTRPNEFDPTRQIVNPRPNLRWGSDVKQARETLFNWVMSDDPMNMLRALITLNEHTRYGTDPIEALKEYMIRYAPTKYLIPQEHKEGRLVRDKYARFIL